MTDDIVKWKKKTKFSVFTLTFRTSELLFCYSLVLWNVPVSSTCFIYFFNLFTVEKQCLWFDCVSLIYLSSLEPLQNFRFQKRALPVRSVPHCKKILASLFLFFASFQSLPLRYAHTTRRRAALFFLRRHVSADSNRCFHSEYEPLFHYERKQKLYLWGPEGTLRVDAQSWGQGEREGEVLWREGVMWPSLVTAAQLQCRLDFNSGPWQTGTLDWCWSHSRHQTSTLTR